MCVGLKVCLSCGPAFTGEPQCCPTFLTLMSDWDHLMGAKDRCHMSIFGCCRHRCQCSAALQLFSKIHRAIDDNEEGHFN